MKFLILALSILSISSSLYASHICYLSLNNVNEFTEMEKFTKKLNEHNKGESITVKEYLSPGGDPEEAFKEMVDSGARCDGLVISGHHTGSFGGKNASGSLGIDFMEKLSCQDKYKDFFNHIKGLWLQGCRTLGVGKIEAYESVDQHTERVGNVLTEDHLEQSFADLNVEFSATLDQDNPLSSRYLRVFPRASVFGWTKTAPGEKSGSQYSIPFHIANLAKVMDDRKRYFDNPIGDQISEESAIKYLGAIEKIIGDGIGNQKTKCGGEENSEDAIKAWNMHGNNGEGWNYAFNNPDLNAYSALFTTNNQFLKTAKKLECFLKNSTDPKEILSVVDEILKNEALIGYTFNSLFELMQRFAKAGDIEEFVAIQNKLKNSPLMNQFIMHKLASKDLGTIRKIDYYAFWKQMTGESNSQIEEIIRDAVVEVVLKKTDRLDFNARDYKQTLMSSLAKNGLLNNRMLRELIDSDKVSASSLGFAAMAVGKSAIPIEGASKLLKEIVTSEKIDEMGLFYTGLAIGDSQHPIEGRSEILNKILNSEKANRGTLSSAAYAIGMSKQPIPGSSKMLNKIVNSDIADNVLLRTVAGAITVSRTPIVGASDILEKIVSSDKVDASVLYNVASAVSRIPIVEASDILEKIVTSDKVDAKGLYDVASTIRSSEQPIEAASEILKKIVKSDKADGGLLREITYIVGFGKNPTEDASEVLREVVNSEKADLQVLKGVTSAILNGKNFTHGASKVLSKIVDSEKTDKSLLNRIVIGIADGEHGIKGASDVLRGVASSDKADMDVLISLVYSVTGSKHQIKGASEVLQKIVDSPNANEKIIENIKTYSERNRLDVKF